METVTSLLMYLMERVVALFREPQLLRLLRERV